MNASSKPDWGSSYRLIAADQWKAKSAAMGRDATVRRWCCNKFGATVVLASGMKT